MKLYEIRQIEQKDPSTYVDLRDYEMEVLKDTLGQLNYSVIHAIGGYTCLDLLYATQDKNISIKNYEISMDVDHVLARQKMYTGWFNKENVVENNSFFSRCTPNSESISSMTSTEFFFILLTASNKLLSHSPGATKFSL